MFSRLPDHGIIIKLSSSTEKSMFEMIPKLDKAVLHVTFLNVDFVKKLEKDGG